MWTAYVRSSDSKVMWWKYATMFIIFDYCSCHPFLSWSKKTVRDKNLPIFLWLAEKIPNHFKLIFPVFIKWCENKKSKYFWCLLSSAKNLYFVAFFDMFHKIIGLRRMLWCIRGKIAFLCLLPNHCICHKLTAQSFLIYVFQDLLKYIVISQNQNQQIRRQIGFWYCL